MYLQVSEPCEISMGLYWVDGPDSRERPLTEPFIFSWDPDGYSGNTDLLSNLKCLFTVSFLVQFFINDIFRAKVRS